MQAHKNEQPINVKWYTWFVAAMRIYAFPDKISPMIWETRYSWGNFIVHTAYWCARR
jgi:hypothetical protein